MGDGLHFLGQVAQSYGFTAAAERLYTESANRYSRQGAKAKAVAVLRDLVGVYQPSGDKAGLTRVKARIRRLETALG